MRPLVVAFALALLGACGPRPAPASADLHAAPAPALPHDAPAPSDLTACAADAECVVVMHESCGPVEWAIHRRWLAEYRSHPDWQRERDPERCANVGRRLPRDVLGARCAQRVCEVIWSERVAEERL